MSHTPDPGSTFTTNLNIELAPFQSFASTWHLLLNDNFSLIDAGVATLGHTHDYSAVYLGLTATASNSTLFDTHEVSYFATAAHTHDYSATYLGLTATASNSTLLDGSTKGAFSTTGHTHDGYLGSTATASNSTLFGGYAVAHFAPASIMLPTGMCTATIESVPCVVCSACNNNWEPADHLMTDLNEKAIAIALTTATIGGLDVTVQAFGTVEFVGEDFSPGMPVYVGESGGIAGTAWATTRMVGVAISETVIYLNAILPPGA